MSIVLRPFLHILAYAGALFLLNTYTDFGGINFTFSIQQGSSEIIKIYLLTGIVFWISFAIIKRIVDFFAFPFKILTLGLFGFVINIAIFYLCQYLINSFIVGIQMQIGSLWSLFIVSFILSVIVSFIYRLLKKLT